MTAPPGGRVPAGALDLHAVADGAPFDASYYVDHYRDYAAQNPRHKLAFYRAMIEAHCGPRRPLRLLDVGCGLGSFLEHMSGVPGWDLSGCDVNADAIRAVRKRLPGVALAEAPATAEPFPAASFDVVTALDVVEHVPDTRAVARAVESQLRPGGLFVLVVPVYDGPTGPVIRLLDRDPTHLHKWGRDAWLTWMAERFDVLDWRGMIRYLLPGGVYLHVTTRRLRRATSAILVVGRKR